MGLEMFPNLNSVVEVKWTGLDQYNAFQSAATALINVVSVYLVECVDVIGAFIKMLSKFLCLCLSAVSLQLTDFGLARVYQSISKAKMKDTGEEVGTLSYMPPEAFDVNYQPTRASDVYSYGILLWSIFTGEEPYSYVQSTIVRFRIPEGDRPCLESVETDQADGLGDLVDLMEQCWHQKPTERPSFLECLAVTENVYENHKQGINDAVHHVQTTLDSGGIPAVSDFPISPRSQLPVNQAVPNRVQTGPPPTQETAGGFTSKQKLKEHSLPYPTTVSSAIQPSSEFKDVPPEHSQGTTLVHNRGEVWNTPSFIPMGFLIGHWGSIPDKLWPFVSPYLSLHLFAYL
ncbi:hypothetical protein DPEC_G00096490 [Dallia pectoralis]|uniref:Uncharacterized protein n=1 Tax=Dallia pectoralis TaxID=75939 RepID=A0ACC2GW04_DALPE|nr:hypothetical protein DPEC_G00096490 [Dallia pectoralis]